MKCRGKCKHRWLSSEVFKMEFEDLKIEVPLDEENLSYLTDVPVKRYQNNEGSNFITGFDVTSKEAKERRLKRARRFGVQNKVETEKVSEIEPLPSAVQRLPKTGDNAEFRPDAILLFGVNEMSTKDVFDYFQEYQPSSIEWIDDISCVVVWEDENSAKRAFINMGTKFTPLADSSIGENEQIENIWRIGTKHPKSKQLLMRCATKADKKMKGAGSRSLYYLVHGRPEQQKRKAKKRGLVSASRRRKINADQNRVNTELHRGPEVEIQDVNSDDMMEDCEDMDIDEPAIKVLITEDMPTGTEKPEGNLYADQGINNCVHSRLSKPSAHAVQARQEKFIKSLPSRAKMDLEEISNSNDLDHSGDLRQKLRNRKQRFNTQPRLSTEVSGD